MPVTVGGANVGVLVPGLVVGGVLVGAAAIEALAEVIQMSANANFFI